MELFWSIQLTKSSKGRCNSPRDIFSFYTPIILISSSSGQVALDKTFGYIKKSMTNQARTFNDKFIPTNTKCNYRIRSRDATIHRDRV